MLHRTQMSPDGRLFVSHNSPKPVFGEPRNSMNIENDSYQAQRQSLDQEIKESPSYKFDKRKASAKEIAKGRVSVIIQEDWFCLDFNKKFRIFKNRINKDRLNLKTIL